MYAPYIPFATEEIYQDLFANRKSWESVHTELMPEPETWIDVLCEDGDFAETLIVVDQIRKYRSAQQMAFAVPIMHISIDGISADAAFLKEAMNVNSVSFGSRSDEPFLNTSTCRIWFSTE